ncbi:MAG: FixH family protein [Bacteroidales bacterium]|jgi:hypothetical protein
MKIKWNWGTKLALWIVVFVLAILFLVYLTFKNDIILVEKDYYPKGLQYQARMDEMANAKSENAVFQILQNQDELIIAFPDVRLDSGNLLFFRPSDSRMDRNFKIRQTDSNHVQLPIRQFTKGKYILKSEWIYQGKKYYSEKIIFIK